MSTNTSRCSPRRSLMPNPNPKLNVSHDAQRERAFKGAARKYGPLVPSAWLRPYIERFRREHGILEGGNNGNEHGLRLKDLVGESTSRRMAAVMAGEYEYMGIYKVDELLCTLGYGSYAVQTDERLREAFRAPEEVVFA